MSDLIFYTNPQSRGAIVRWMLEEVAANYETKLLEYGPIMKSKDYLKINPMGKVPAIMHDGQVITESAAICAYLADAFPQQKLAPSPTKRADYYRWLFFTSGPVEAAMTNKALNFEVPKEKEGFVGHGNFELVMNTLRKAVTDSPFVAGENFSAADVYVGSQIGWGLEFGTIPAYDEFRRYWEKISQREALIRARKLDAELLEANK